MEKFQPLWELNTQQIEERTIEIAEWMIENGATIRQAADWFGYSKTTIYEDMTVRLKTLNVLLYNQIILLLDYNRSVRHTRGGYATRTKYSAL